jgi:hypothetical protein
MKKQFTIKSAQVIKNVKATAAKYESANKLNFIFLGETECCSSGPNWTFSKPVFSL